MEFWTLSLYCGLAVAVWMLIAWLISVPLNDVSIVDLFWGAGFIVVVWIAFVCDGATGPRRWLIAILVTIWGARLSGYLAWRNLGHGEDKRYTAMRKKNPETFWVRSLLTVFVLQGAIMYVVSFPLQAAAGSSQPLHWIDVAGMFLWCVGLFFEVVGDWQLAAFKADPSNRGEVLDRGLWRYTRHPNYFGDFCVWWGFYLIAVAGGEPGQSSARR